MRRMRPVFAVLLAAASLLAPERSAADWQNPQGVCVDSRGCDSSSSSGSDAFSSGPPSIAWGGMTKRATERVKECGNKPLCWIVRGAMLMPLGLAFDAPVFAFKGIVWGGYYGAKGLYYGARGAGQGVAFVGKGVGRGLAYPFNRPPKPVVAPATWEQYKHDVLKHQKRLTKADKANKANQVWCVNHIPLAVSPNRAAWEARCNPGDAVSRSRLPADIIAAPPEPVVTQLKQDAPSVPIAVAAPPAAPSLAGPPAVPAALAELEAEAGAAAPAVASQTQEPLAPAPPEDPGAAVVVAQAPAAGVPLTPFSRNEAAVPATASEPQARAIAASGIPGASAPVFPAAWGTPEQVGAMMPGNIAAAAPDAFEYIRRGRAFVRERGQAHALDAAKSGAKEIVSAGYAPAEVLVNMFDLPELIVPKILKAAGGELSLEEANLMTFEAVNVLYNLGCAPNALLAKMIEKRDAMKGLMAWGVDASVGKSAEGVAALGGQLYADRAMPRHATRDGTTGEVAALLNKGKADETSERLLRDALQAQRWLKEAANGAVALRWGQPSGAKP